VLRHASQARRDPTPLSILDLHINAGSVWIDGRGPRAILQTLRFWGTFETGHEKTAGWYLANRAWWNAILVRRCHAERINMVSCAPAKGSDAEGLA
jgi:hypothetical protein